MPATFYRPGKVDQAIHEQSLNVMIVEETMMNQQTLWTDPGAAALHSYQEISTCRNSRFRETIR